MAIREPKVRKDGFNALFGVDSSVKPVLLHETQAAFAGNVVFRGGFPASRPGFTQRPFVFPTNEVAAWFESHILQGGIVYQPKFGDPSAIVSIGGRIFSVAFDTWIVTEITPIISVTADAFVAPAVGSNVDVYISEVSHIEAGYPIYINGSEYLVVENFQGSGSGTVEVTNINATPGAVAGGALVSALWVNSPILGQAWMVQAEQFVIIQDDQSRPIVFDGTKSFRTEQSLQQVPTGSVMAYGQGRLWVAVNKNEYVASDIVRGSSGTPQYERWDAILYFKENTYIANGGAFSVPYQAGAITAMQFAPVLDTATGQGPLIIFTENGAFTNNAPVDRALWAVMQSPIQTVILTSGGSLSFYGTKTTTNSDLFFRNREGLKSFYHAVREFKDSWGTTPVSSEMTQVLVGENQSLLKFSSAIQFDNRLWFTVQPAPLPNQIAGAYHRGLGTLDFHSISNMRVKSPPTYDGIQTGIRPTLLLQGEVNGVDRALCFSLNGDNVNELWEISKSNPFDNTDGRIISFSETRSYFFIEDKNPMLVNLLTAELYVDDVKGTVDFRLLYKPDQYPCWIEWGRDQSVCAGWRDCLQDNEDCTTPVTRRPGYKTRLNFGQPADVDMDVDDKPARRGYEFQFRIEWTGHCRIRKFLAKFSDVDEEVFPTVRWVIHHY